VLSIGALSGGGQGEYYISLGREDYYTEGGEPPGKWLGRGAVDLGLSGTVEADDFRNLLKGYSPDGRPLIQNAGEPDHQPGWDLTYSPPKSVSTLWALSDEGARHNIQRAHDLAVAKGIGYIEDEFSFTRRGKGGVEREQAKLIVAAFQHGTSRAQDPQLHTHAVLINVGVREDGTTGTILSKPVYQTKMASGAIYRAELSFQLEKLGYEIERDGDFFKINGVPKALCEEFSKRRAEIEAELKRTGFEGAKASAAATLATRQVKGHTAREELFRQWQEVGKEFEITKEQAKDLKRDEPIRRDERHETKTALDEALDKITQQQSHFSEKEIVRRTAEGAQGRGITADDVRRGVKDEIANSKELVYLGRVDGEKRYTTREMLELESKMLSTVKEMQRGSLRLKEVIAINPELSLEQKEALFYITESPGKMKAVSGMAGAGKTMLLTDARKAWEASGYEVIGASLAGKAARGLEEGAGIKSTTLHKTLLEIERGNLKLTDKTVLVIDEAGMVGTRQMAKVIDEVKRADAKLVLVGDEKQLQPIDAGAPFRAIGDVVGRVELKDIRRQRDEKDVEAIKNIVAGDSQKALQSYAERGLLTVTEDREKAIDALIIDWKKEALHNPKDTLIITGTRLEATILNRKAQEERKLEGLLGDKSTAVNGEQFFENDRVMFTKRSPFYRVENGDAGTIERIDEKEALMTIRIDGADSRKIKIPYKDFENIKLGYAATTHKFQGATGERCFVLAGGDMQDRELSYVQASRARGETRIYTERGEVSESTAALARQMNKSRQKGMAIEVLRGKEKTRTELIYETHDERERKVGLNR
jgi:Ti-type conjugative transfer relaxase TraA